MKIEIDLVGLKTKEEIFSKFGEVFEFGGPNGNSKIGTGTVSIAGGWGFNYDAFNDSLRSLESGGIWGTSKKFHFPLDIKISNSKEFFTNDPEGFEILKDIFKSRVEGYAKEGKILKVEFV